MERWELGGLAFRFSLVGEIPGLRGCAGTRLCVLRLPIGGDRRRGGDFSDPLGGCDAALGLALRAPAERRDGGASWVLNGPVCPSAAGRFQEVISANRIIRCVSSVGGAGGNRTHDLRVKSPLLCQLSYGPAPQDTMQERHLPLQ